MIALKLRITCPENETYALTLEKGDFSVCFDSDTGELTLPEPGEYRLHIEQLPEPRLKKRYGVPLFLLTAPVQGLFHILLFNTDSHWEKDIRADLLKGDARLLIAGDADIEMSMANSKFNSAVHSFDPPQWSLSGGQEIHTEGVRNPSDIGFQFWKHIRKILSIAAVFWILFGFLTVQAAKIGNVPALAVTVGVLVLLTGIAIGLLIAAKRKKNRLSAAYERSAARTGG
ncbi:MAG: hypothetical protein ACI3XR_02450 [Eubacteriales bacterium]